MVPQRRRGLVADGHDLTYLTRRQWERVQEPDLPSIRVVAVGPRLGFDTESGRRSLLPPLVFGFGVLRHLLRHGRRYEVVQTASFPYSSLLAAAIECRRGGYRIVVDWHEVWTGDYWRDYLGRLGGAVGWVQRRCLRVPQRADALVAVHHRGPALRASTSDRFVRNAARLSLRGSADVVLEAYGGRG